MIQDIWAVFWKECKELKHLLVGTRTQWLGLVIFLGIFGIFMPLQAGKAFIKAPSFMVIFAFLPLFVVMQVIADSVAGERERHTLETLLATRLSDRSILLGKIFTVVLYGWVMTLCVFVIMIVSINLIHSSSHWVLPPGSILFTVPVASFLIAFLGSTIGIYISMRASTVKQAQQTIAFIVMALWFTPFLILPLVLQHIPKGIVKTFAEQAKTMNLFQALLVCMLILLVLDKILFQFIEKRFQRSKLIKDG